MIYNAVVFVYILLAMFPCIGEQERAAVELLVNLILTFNFELGRIILTREQYEQAQEFLPQLLVLAARHNLAFPTDSNHSPSFMNMFVILQTIVHPLIGDPTLLNRLEIYATEEEARQIFKLSPDRLQAAVDAWVCENSEFALPKSTTPAPADAHTHNLVARGHGDIWWNAPCMSKPRATTKDAQSSPTPLTEANLRKHTTLQQPQLASNFLSVPPAEDRIHVESTTSIGVLPPAPSATGSRPSNLMPTWVKYLGVHSSRGGFSNSTHSFGPHTPRDLNSPQASWGYRTSSDLRSTRILPWDDAASDGVLDDDEVSVDMYVRPHAKARKAKEATFGRKLVRRLKAALNAIHL